MIKNSEYFVKHRHDIYFKGYLIAAYREFTELPFWKFVWYLLLFDVTEGWILIFANIYWIIKTKIMKKKYEKLLKNNQDLGENS